MLALLKLPRISCCSNINFEKRKISHGFYTAAPMISSKLSNFLLLLMSLICKRQHLPPMFWLDWQIPWVWPGPESACSCGAKHRLSLRWTVGGRGPYWPQSCCSRFYKLELINTSQVSRWVAEEVLLQSLFGKVIRKCHFAKSEWLCHALPRWSDVHTGE